MSLGVFIIPKKPLITDIFKWKKKIEIEFPGEPYTLHPPHMTLINVEVTDKEDCLIALKSEIDKIKPIRVLVNSRDLFWDDHSTGGHTMYFSVEPNKVLFGIQKSLATVIKPFIKRLPLPNSLINNNKLYNSFKKYGFPFVGKHWKPHFSVSSIRTNKTDPIFKDFLSEMNQYNFIVDHISLWNINGDKHIKLKDYKIE